MKYFGLLIAASVIFVSARAAADQRLNAIAVNCIEPAEYFSIASFGYDHNIGFPANSDQLFSNSTDLGSKGESAEVARCDVRGKQYALTRTFLNSPRPRGACGGADWAEYQLSYGGAPVATFHAGCRPVFVEANESWVKVCSISLGSARCEQRWLGDLMRGEAGPIKHYLFGSFDE